MYLKVFLIIYSFFLWYVRAQGSCEPFQGSPLTSYVCDEFVMQGSIAPPNVFVPTNKTQQDLDAQAAHLLLQLNIAPRSCAIAGYELLCRTVFRVCPSIVPACPCKSLCLNVLDKCGDSTHALQDLGVNVTLIDCDMLDPNNPGQALWPSNFTQYNIRFGNNNVTISVPCNDTTLAQPSYAGPDVCPWPLKLVDKTMAGWNDNEPPCAVGCPDPMFTIDEWNQLQHISTVESAVSLVILTYLAVSYLIIPSYRNFPVNLNINLIVVAYIVAVGMLIGAHNPQKLLCKNDTEVNTQSTNAACGLCGLQGTLIVLGLMSGLLWWTMIVFNLYMMVVRGYQRKALRPFVKYYYLISYGGGGLICVIALASQNIAAVPPFIFCYVTFAANGWYQYGLIYIPLGIGLLVGMTCLVFVFYKMHLVFRAAPEMHRGSFRSSGAITNNGDPSSPPIKQNTRTRIPRYYLRIVILLLACLIEFIFIYAFRFYVQEQKEYIQQGEKDWVACSLNMYLAGNEANAMQICGPHPEHRINVHVHMVHIFVLGMGGILITLSMLVDGTIFRFWQVKIMTLLGKETKQLDDRSYDQSTVAVYTSSLAPDSTSSLSPSPSSTDLLAASPTASPNMTSSTPQGVEPPRLDLTRMDSISGNQEYTVPLQSDDSRTHLNPDDGDL
eukprot:TRINITY_DN8018_c0_g1_i1.p1 TRINITY_DN8018_c0_g1~~TRINITY_DN8018_c0_g1_i1.p1  ORF type:complete len:666 (-),score=128.48 TRINITY_DN8018_c0_g1_i1:39-2036(-)